MYSYDFVFYKPGKEFYTWQEVMHLQTNLLRADFEVNGNWRMDEKEKEKIIHIDFDLRKSGLEFFLLLRPAEERFQGALGQLSITEEQFEEDSKESTKLMEQATGVIFTTLRPLFTWGDHEVELGRLEPFLRFDRIGALACTNIFSKELVERLGGVRNLLFFPTTETEKEGHQLLEEYSFLPLRLGKFPTEPTESYVAIECEHRFPGALLRSFEIPALKAIERE